MERKKRLYYIVNRYNVINNSITFAMDKKKALHLTKIMGMIEDHGWKLCPKEKYPLKSKEVYTPSILEVITDGLLLGFDYNELLVVFERYYWGSGRKVRSLSNFDKTIALAKKRIKENSLSYIL